MAWSEKPARLGRRPLRFKVESTFLLQKCEVAEDVLFYLLRLGLGIDFLQVRDDLPDGVLAVAALDDFEAGAEQAQGAFGHEQDALLIVFSEAAAWGEAREAVQVKSHSLQDSFAG
jgi:hypothetical protein